MDNLEKRIEQLEKDIMDCRQAVVDAEEALDAAEKELNEVLASLPPQGDEPPLMEANERSPLDETEPPLNLVQE